MLAYLYEYLNIKYKEEIPDALIRAAYASIADVVIIAATINNDTAFFFIFFLSFSFSQKVFMNFVFI